jgi:hypothetical protein
MSAMDLSVPYVSPVAFKRRYQEARAGGDKTVLAVPLFFGSYELYIDGKPVCWSRLDSNQKENEPND